MSGFGGRSAMAGAARGVARGLEINRQRADNKARELRLQSEEERRQKEHEQTTKLNEHKLSEAEASVATAEQSRMIDEAARAFVSSGGQDTQAAQEAYRNIFGEDVNIQMRLEGNEPRYDLDFGNGRVLKNADREQMAGLILKMKDPVGEMKAERDTRQASAAAEEKFGRDKELADYKHSRQIELENVKAGNRKPEYATDQSGRYLMLDGASATPVQGPDGKPVQMAPGGTGNTPALIQSVDAATRHKLASPQYKGMDPDEVWLETLAEQSQSKSKNPEDAAASFYDGVLKKLLPESPDLSYPDDVARIEAAKETAALMTEEFKRMYYGGRAQPGQAQQPPPAAAPPPAAGPTALPPQAAAQLKEGRITTFGNGQRWTIQNGQPVQVQ